MNKLNTIFMGNPNFAIPALDELYQNPLINLIGICGSPDRPVGRGKKITSPETIKFAKEKQITFFQTENINKDEQFYDFCVKENVDLIIVLAFSHFLGKKILEIPKLGCFNIHTSLLPKYRGSSPIHYALLNGDSETGVTIQKMVKKMDAGDIVNASIVPISKDDDYISLSSKLKVKCASVLHEFVQIVNRGNFSARKQNELNVSFAPLIKKEDGRINPEKETYNNLNNKLRAFCFWPGVFCFINRKRVKILSISLYQEDPISSGTLISKNKMLLLGLSDTTVRITKLIPEGKKELTDVEFCQHFNNREELDFS